MEEEQNPVFRCSFSQQLECQEKSVKHNTCTKFENIVKRQISIENFAWHKSLENAIPINKKRKAKHRWY